MPLSSDNLGQLLIKGRWVGGEDRETRPIVDPSTGQKVGRVACATTSDVAAAVQASVEGFHAWRATPAWERSTVLRRAAKLLTERHEQLAEILTREQGKPLAEARGEILASAEQFDWCADEARRLYGRIIPGRGSDDRSEVLRQPIGPVAAFSAWNFPALLPTRKLAAALAAGCSVIVKPADETPFTVLAIAEILEEAGLPAGAVAVLMGDAPRIAEQLLAAPEIRKLSLTGSVPVGRAVMRQAAESLTPVTLELGGHAPVLVFADADLDSAIPEMVAAKFRNAGQVCAAPSRFLVAEEIADVVVERFAGHVRSLRVGPGVDVRTDVGPLSNHRRVEAVEEMVADGVRKGASVVVGGHRPEGVDPGGFFYAPTVMVDAGAGMRILDEEPFGPIAPFTTFSSTAEALELANASQLGLASYVYTRSLRTAHDAAEGIEAGMVGVNTMAVALAETPFGGIKDSGFGREGGVEGIESFTFAKHVRTVRR